MKGLAMIRWEKRTEAPYYLLHCYCVNSLEEKRNTYIKYIHKLSIGEKSQKEGVSLGLLATHSFTLKVIIR